MCYKISLANSHAGPGASQYHPHSPLPPPRQARPGQQGQSGTCSSWAS